MGPRRALLAILVVAAAACTQAAPVAAPSPSPEPPPPLELARPADWDRSVLLPTSRSVAPAELVADDTRGGTATVAAGTIVLRRDAPGDDPRVVVDLGIALAGHLSAEVVEATHGVEVASSQSLAYLGDHGDDRARPQLIAPGRLGSWWGDELLGGVRFLQLRLPGEAPVGASASVRDLRLVVTALPGLDVADREARFPGWFRASDRELERAWYGSVHTLQLATVHPRTGSWEGDRTIGAGRRVIVDGPRRDRYVWAGDLAASVDIAAVSTADADAVADSLRALADTQRADGMINAFTPPGDEPPRYDFLSYHLWWLRAYAGLHAMRPEHDAVAGLWRPARDAVDFLEDQLTTDDLGTVVDGEVAAPIGDAGIGQRFTVGDQPVTAVAARVGTSGAIGRQVRAQLWRDGAAAPLADQQLTATTDNGWVELRPVAPLAAGRYELVLTDADGPLAWWGSEADALAGDSATASRTPVAGDRSLRLKVPAGSGHRLLLTADAPRHYLYASSGRESLTNVLAVLSLRELAEVAAGRGDDALAQRWRGLADEVADGLVDELWDEQRGVLIHSSQLPEHVELLGNALAVRHGLLNDERAARALDAVADAAGRVERGTLAGTLLDLQLVAPFATTAEVDALFTAGRDDEAFRRTRALWGWMFNAHKELDGVTEPPATTAWEHVRRDGRPFRLATGSLAHPWSGGVAPLLTRWVLGIQPTTPGGTRWRVEPHPGDLTSAHGGVPLATGELTVRWELGGGAFRLAVDVPPETSGVVSLPWRGGRVTVDGRELSAGSGPIGASDGTGPAGGRASPDPGSAYGNTGPAGDRFEVELGPGVHQLCAGPGC